MESQLNLHQRKAPGKKRLIQLAICTHLRKLPIGQKCEGDKSENVKLELERP